VADALSRVFEGQMRDSPEMVCANLLESLPLVYSSMQEHQAANSLCQEIRKQIDDGRTAAGKFHIHRDLVCFSPKGAKRRRWLVPSILRPMLLAYFHDSPLAGYLGAHKTFKKIAVNFWWPQMSAQFFQYVRGCELCQRAKLAQTCHVGWHSAKPPTQPMDRLFVDFVGPLTRTKRGNSAILVVVDAFSKFVWFYTVRRMSSKAVMDCLERNYFPAYGTPNYLISDNARAFRTRKVKDLCFRWGVRHVTTTPY